MNDFHLNDVSLQIPEGSIVGFVGENGAGKTTTLKTLMGLVSEEKGEIKLFGKEVSQKSTDFKEHISVVFDDAFFYEKFTITQIPHIMNLK